LRKLHRIVDQIPKHLLKSDSVGPDMVAVRAEVHDQIQLFLEDVVARDFEAVTEQSWTSTTSRWSSIFPRVMRVRSNRSSIKRASNCTLVRMATTSSRSWGERSSCSAR